MSRWRKDSGKTSAASWKEKKTARKKYKNSYFSLLPFLLKSSVCCKQNKQKWLLAYSPFFFLLFRFFFLLVWQVLLTLLSRTRQKFDRQNSVIGLNCPMMQHPEGSFPPLSMQKYLYTYEYKTAGVGIFNAKILLSIKKKRRRWRKPKWEQK